MATHPDLSQTWLAVVTISSVGYRDSCYDDSVAVRLAHCIIDDEELDFRTAITTLNFWEWPHWFQLLFMYECLDGPWFHRAARPIGTASKTVRSSARVAATAHTSTSASAAVGVDQKHNAAPRCRRHARGRAAECNPAARETRLSDASASIAEKFRKSQPSDATDENRSSPPENSCGPRLSSIVMISTPGTSLE